MLIDASIDAPTRYIRSDPLTLPSPHIRLTVFPYKKFISLVNHNSTVVYNPGHCIGQLSDWHCSILFEVFLLVEEILESLFVYRLTELLFD